VRYYEKEIKMTTPNHESKQNPQDKSGLYDLSRKVLLAAVGAAVVAQDEIKTFVDRMVEEGEIAEKDARQLIREVMDRREKLMCEKRSDKEKKAGTVTPQDLDAISTRIMELNRQIEELRKAQNARSEGEQPGQPS
jgi:polyhydroxyalkanoate synthesis regulator phasin